MGANGVFFILYFGVEIGILKVSSKHIYQSVFENPLHIPRQEM